MSERQTVRRGSSSVAQGPVGLGYVQVAAIRAGIEGDAAGVVESTALVAAGIGVMEEFARRCYYELGEVFIEDDPSRRLGWGSLVDAVRVVRPVAVLVPDLDGLRLPPTELNALRARLRLVTSAPLVAARPVVEAPQVGPAGLDALSHTGRADRLPGSVRPAAGRAVMARRSRAGWRLSWGR
jgi:hypothetical protein